MGTDPTLCCMADMSSSPFADREDEVVVVCACLGRLTRDCGLLVNDSRFGFGTEEGEGVVLVAT